MRSVRHVRPPRPKNEFNLGLSGNRKAYDMFVGNTVAPKIFEMKLMQIHGISKGLNLFAVLRYLILNDSTNLITDRRIPQQLSPHEQIVHHYKFVLDLCYFYILLLSLAALLFHIS